MAFTTNQDMYGRGDRYGVDNSGAHPAPPPMFQATSGTPSFPNVGTAHQFLANPVVAEAAAQYGHGLVTMGQSYLDRNVSRFAPGLKRYFTVDTSYVLKKLQIILFPYTHKEWSIRFMDGNEQPVPRDDVNSPDLYIPTMSMVTYVLLTGLVLGVQNRFTPEHLGINASSLLAWLVAEILVIWFSLFVLQVNSRLSWLDILVYCSYKYVSMTFCVVAGIVGGAIGYYIALAWTTAAIVYFEVQSLRLHVQPNVTQGANRTRNYVILLIAVFQPLLILWLTWGLVMYRPLPSLQGGGVFS